MTGGELVLWVRFGLLLDKPRTPNCERKKPSRQPARCLRYQNLAGPSLTSEIRGLSSFARLGR